MTDMCEDIDVLKFMDIEAVVDRDDGENSEYNTDDFGMPRSSLFYIDISTNCLKNLWQMMKMQTVGTLRPKYTDGKT